MLPKVALCGPLCPCCVPSVAHTSVFLGPLWDEGAQGLGVVWAARPLHPNPQM